MEQTELMWVSHIGEAAALVLSGGDIIALRVNPFNKARRQTQFGFKRQKTIAIGELEDEVIDFTELSMEYWKGMLDFNSLAYYKALDDVRRKRWEFEQTLEPIKNTINTI